MVPLSSVHLHNTISNMSSAVVRIKTKRPSKSKGTPPSVAKAEHLHEKEEPMEQHVHTTSCLHEIPVGDQVENNVAEMHKQLLHEIMDAEGNSDKQSGMKIGDEVGDFLTNDVGRSPESFGVLSHLGKFVEEPYSIIESYFQGKHLERLVRHQIESYNHFVNYQVQRTIQMFNPVIVHSENDYIECKDKYLLEIQISFTNFKLFPPQIHENNGATKPMLPCEAKLRNFTYASTMTVDIKIDYVIRNTDNMDVTRIVTKILPKINIGKMPIMLKSNICMLSQKGTTHATEMGECPMDCGGYFIIKGSEKTVLGQERAAENRVVSTAKIPPNGVGLQKSNQFLISNAFLPNTLK